MDDLKWTLKVARDSDGSELWWLFSSDGHKFCIGEYPEVEALHDKLNDLVAQGNYDGELSADDHRIVAWLTVDEVSAETDIPPSTVRRAARKGYIAGARPGPWMMPLQAVLDWRAGPNAKRRPDTK